MEQRERVCVFQKSHGDGSDIRMEFGGGLGSYAAFGHLKCLSL
ncbi:uncharacterized protein G2W53_037803 [Senna tora]|uniref:Uncharacterized protein n=1 Tax=Senna tora TaxID=362788 RepID=A0A834W1C7_9FABA|nr:uncharacterized protein G2W53_037803 [Senna tora]